jgi:hypothetical protein
MDRSMASPFKLWNFKLTGPYGTITVLDIYREQTQLWPTPRSIKTRKTQSSRHYNPKSKSKE